MHAVLSARRQQRVINTVQYKQPHHANTTLSQKQRWLALQGTPGAPFLRRRTYLGLDVCVVVVLQQQGGRLGVVLAGGDVQRGQTHLALGVVLQQDGHHLVVALLEGDGQRGEAVLGGCDRRSLVLF